MAMEPRRPSQNSNLLNKIYRQKCYFIDIDCNRNIYQITVSPLLSQLVSVFLDRCVWNVYSSCCPWFIPCLAFKNLVLVLTDNSTWYRRSRKNQSARTISKQSHNDPKDIKFIEKWLKLTVFCWCQNVQLLV